MKQYTVRVSPATSEQIADYALIIQEQAGSEEVSQRWVRRVYASIGGLAYWPRRFALAEEDAYRDYEIRRKLVGRYLALYTIDDDSDTVRVIGFRHGSRLPRPSELP